MYDLLRFFEYDHLPERLQEISRPFAELAGQIAARRPDDHQDWRRIETEMALRKLLEAKDCAVRAAL